MNRFNLTGKERAIIDLIAYGHDTNTILDCLSMDYIEYKRHKQQIFKKLNISRIIQVLPVAVKLDLFDIKK